MKKIIILIICLLPIVCYAEDITKTSTILVDNTINKKLTDSNENSYVTIKQNQSITINNDEVIDGVYIIYEMSAKKGKILNNDTEILIGQNGFLHEYINISNNIKNNTSITLNYDEDVKIAEIYVLSAGEIPEYIELWNPPCEEADLLLFSTHSDDEQLFFAGLMPHYIDKGAKIQVIYFTNHNDNPKRLHEQIHGLYTIGIRNYPIIGFIPDAWSTNLDDALRNIKKAGYTEDDVLKFEVEMIRRFKPFVVVGHDEKGEYSHGQHILNTYILKQAIELTNDSEYDIDSINKYGLWEVAKTYLHLYQENKIIMDYDIPLEQFNGKTAYEVSKEGYAKHLSQQYTWFTKWLTGVDKDGKGTKFTSAKEIKKYSPCEFGLYKTTVGEDTEKNDMFENLTLRKDIVKDEPKETIKDNENNDIQPNIKNNNKSFINELSVIGIIIIIFIIFKLFSKLKKM